MTQGRKATKIPSEPEYDTKIWMWWCFCFRTFFVFVLPLFSTRVCHDHAFFVLVVINILAQVHGCVCTYHTLCKQNSVKGRCYVKNLIHFLTVPLLTNIWRKHKRNKEHCRWNVLTTSEKTQCLNHFS